MSKAVRTPRGPRASRAEQRTGSAAALRERLLAADAEMDVPEGLWERVRAGDTAAEPAPAGPSPSAPSRAAGALSAPARLRAKRHGPLVLTAVAAGAVTLIATGAWWLASPGTEPARPAGPRATLSVHNTEASCQARRVHECALRVAEDPYARYAAPGNRAALVWHRDRLTAECTVTDGALVKDEKGTASTSWYLVRTEDGAEGWLPGVRARGADGVPTCSDSQDPAK